MHKTMSQRRPSPPSGETPGGGAATGPQQARLAALSSQLNAAAPVQRAPNRTGLPDHLKAGVESLSGLSMDHVRVHYNSAMPAQLSAHAYAQGSDIHLAPGQGRHLPHEAWHVVQQAQGRVRAVAQMARGVPVNDDPALEHEADVMGARAASLGMHSAGPAPALRAVTGPAGGAAAIQAVLVDHAGNALGQQQVEDLIQEHSDRSGEIVDKQMSLTSYVVVATRSGLTFNPYAPSIGHGFHYSVPPGHTVTGNHPTSKRAAESQGMQPTLKRQNFAPDFTQQILDRSPYGQHYVGSSQLQSGKGLKESGLDRTHHLSNSSVMVIVQWLHHNRGWTTRGMNFVLQWMNALTGFRGAALFWELHGGNLTDNDLNRIADALSNNPFQVGIGNAKTNQKVVGSYFDESRTTGGFPTPVASVIAQYTQGLTNAGVPPEIIAAVLAQVQDAEGKTVTSMTVEWPPYDKDEPGGSSGGGGPGGGGLGGGGLGGSAAGMSSGIY